MKKIISKSIAILLTLAALFSIGLLVFSANAETDTEKPLIELCDVNSKPFIPEEYGMAVSGLEGIPSYNQEIGWSGSYAMTDESTYAHYFWVREFSAGDTVYVAPSSENAYNFRLLGIESVESIGTLTDGKVFFEITQAGQYVLTMLSDSPELTVKSHFNNTKESEPQNGHIYVSGNFAYEILEDGTAELYLYNPKYGGHVTIPETLAGRKVVGMGDAFKSNEKLTGVTIPNTVKYIGTGAFQGCENLKSVELPDSVESIGTRSFAYCDSLETFIIGSGLKKVADNAFIMHNTNEVLSIKEFIIDPDNPYFSSKDGVWYNKDMTTLIRYPFANERMVYEIPEGVETIAGDAFYKCNVIRKLIFPNSMRKLEAGALDYAENLSEIVMNDGLIDANDGFAGTDIRTLQFPESVTEAGAFIDTKLRYVAIPEAYTGVVDFAFSHNLVSIYLPKGVSEFACQAFDYTYKLTDIYYAGTQEEFANIPNCGCEPSSENCKRPEDIATIHYNHTHTLDRYYVVKAATPDSKGVADHACVCGYSVREEYEYEPNSKIQGFCGHGLTWDFDFATGALKISGYGDMWDYWDITEFPWYGIKDRIKSVELPEGITSISEYAFENCVNLSELIIPDSVISIGEYAFSGCSGIKEFSLGNELETIGDYAFYGCTGIEKVDLHENITSIGENTFAGCSGMKEFYVGKNIKNFDLKYLKDFAVLEKLYIHPDCSGYIVDDSGGVIKREIIYDEKYYNVYCFNYYPPCAPDETYAVPESVVYIKSNTFNGNKNLKTIYIPKSLKTIYDSAFAGCTGITDIYYCGTAEEANNITIEANNDCLYNATIHFEHTHSFTETAEKAATCSQDGYVKSICGECGYAETEVIPETGHTSTGWIYHADNVLYKTCSVCGLVLERNALQWHVNEYKLELWRTDGYRFESYVYDNKGQIFPIKLNFTSSDENVVTVERYSYNGAYFDAVGLGEATITVTIDGTDISRDIKITVVPAENWVEWIVDRKSIGEELVAEGAPIPLPEPPVKEGYEFVGWTPEVPETMPYDLYDDLVFTAVFNKVTKAENFDVTASYAEGCFDEDVSLDVAEIQGDREPGGVYMVEGEYYKQIGFYNIKTVNENGNVLQPNEGCTVTIKMAIPDAYKNRTKFMIYHRFVDGGREQLSTGAGTIKVENGYLIFNVSKFSEFEIFAKADKSEIPDTPVDKVSPSIKITSLPVKTVYACGEDIDLTGIRVIYTNSNGEKKYVSNIKHLSVSGYNSKEVEKQTVTVKYGDCSDTFEVTVKYTFWQWIIKILTFGLFRF